MGPHDWGEILPPPAAGSFLPDPGGPRSPGYSCVHCGAVLARRHAWSLLIHCWNKSVVCNWRKGDFRVARLYQGT